MRDGTDDLRPLVRTFPTEAPRAQVRRELEREAKLLFTSLNPKLKLKKRPRTRQRIMYFSFKDMVEAGLAYLARGKGAKTYLILKSVDGEKTVAIPLDPWTITKAFTREGVTPLSDVRLRLRKSGRSIRLAIKMDHPDTLFDPLERTFDPASEAAERCMLLREEFSAKLPLWIWESAEQAQCYSGNILERTRVKLQETGDKLIVLDFYEGPLKGLIKGEYESCGPRGKLHDLRPPESIGEYRLISNHRGYSLKKRLIRARSMEDVGISEEEFLARAA